MTHELHMTKDESFNEGSQRNNGIVSSIRFLLVPSQKSPHSVLPFTHSLSNFLPTGSRPKSCRPTSVPNDALTAIFAFLTAFEVCCLRQLSKYWYDEINNPNNSINVGSKQRWDNQFDRMLRRTSRHFTSGRLIRLSRTLLLCEIHPDCSYSGLLIRSKAAGSRNRNALLTVDKPFAPATILDGAGNWSPVSIEVQELNNEDKWFNVPEYPFDSTVAASPTSIWQIPILREALEERLYQLFGKLTQRLNRMDEIVLHELSKDASKIIKNRTSRQEKYQHTNRERCDSSLVVDFSNLSESRSWSEAVILLMSDNQIFLDEAISANRMFPIIVNYQCETTERNSHEMIDRLTHQWKWLERDYRNCIELMIPLNDILAYCDTRLATTDENSGNSLNGKHPERSAVVPALKVMQDLFELPCGSIELPVTLKEMGTWPDHNVEQRSIKVHSSKGHLTPIWIASEREKNWINKMQKIRHKRHCAEMYFPKWFLDALADIGRISFVETSIFKDCEETSFYLLAAQCGPYLAGLFWSKRFIDYRGRARNGN